MSRKDKYVLTPMHFCSCFVFFNYVFVFNKADLFLIIYKKYCMCAKMHRIILRPEMPFETLASELKKFYERLNLSFSFSSQIFF